MAFVRLKDNPKIWRWCQRFDYNFKLQNKTERKKEKGSMTSIRDHIQYILKDNSIENDLFPHRQETEKLFCENLENFQDIYPDDGLMHPVLRRYFRILKNNKIYWENDSPQIKSDQIKNSLYGFFMGKLIVLKKLEDIALKVQHDIFHEQLSELLYCYGLKLLMQAFHISKALDKWLEWEDNTYLSLYATLQACFWAILDPENERNFKAVQALTEEEIETEIENRIKNWEINSAKKDSQ
jgi:hypothetical protein